jgi:hypothetical protein
LPTGDVNVTYNRVANAGGTLTTAIQSGVIYNSMVNASAAIAQSKLSMTAASTRDNATGIAQADRGLASFDSAYFTANGGWISLKSSDATTTGIGYDKIRYVTKGTILGNLTSGATTIQEITPGTVVSSGDGIKNASFTSNGAMTVAGNGTSNTYSVTPITTARGTNSLVKTDGSGSIDVNSLFVNGVETVKVSGINNTTLNLVTPGGISFFKSIGATGAQTITTLTGTLDTTPGKLQATDISTSASDVSVVGNITGNWKVQPSSYWDVTSGTLKSTTLYAGADSTATGTIQGIWKLDNNNPKSVFDATAGTLKSTTLTAGAAGTAGTIIGAWTLYGGLTLDTSSSITFGATGTLDISSATATLKTRTLNTGASGTGGTVQGQWTINSGSTFIATGIQSQANSATISATTGLGASPDDVIASRIVLRDSNGDFKARNITATKFSGAFNGTADSVANALTNGSYINTLSYDGSAAKSVSVNASSDGSTTGNVVARDSNGDFGTRNITVGTLYANVLNANNSGTGLVQGTWSLDTGAKFQATYADLAEYYEGDQDYEPGTVLVFGGDKEVTTSTVINDTRIAGVVTTEPAYVMNKDQSGIRVCIALAGRVPCKVVGRVKKGDMLTTSATPGYAVKAMTPTLGAIIGKALEDKDYGEAGVIEIAVGRA